MAGSGPAAMGRRFAGVAWRHIGSCIHRRQRDGEDEGGRSGSCGQVEGDGTRMSGRERRCEARQPVASWRAGMPF